MSKSFSTHVSEDLRLRVLQLLQQADGYDLNIRILSAALEELGHRQSADTLRVELAWLEEQGLVATHTVGAIVVATGTARGLDVAAGRARVPGVRRPDPT